MKERDTWSSPAQLPVISEDLYKKNPLLVLCMKEERGKGSDLYRCFGCTCGWNWSRVRKRGEKFIRRTLWCSSGMLCYVYISWTSKIIQPHLHLLLRRGHLARMDNHNAEHKTIRASGHTDANTGTVSLTWFGGFCRMISHSPCWPCEKADMDLDTGTWFRRADSSNRRDVFIRLNSAVFRMKEPNLLKQSRTIGTITSFGHCWE